MPAFDPARLRLASRQLHRWEEARTAYERREREDPANLAWRLGRMRCYHALGDWATLSSLADEAWLAMSKC